MCRLLFIRAASPFSIRAHLEIFSEISRNSTEYQGHGWGCAWLRANQWQFHHDIRPIWENELADFGESTLLLAHARSAFRDEGIRVENNMPFFDGRYVFIFNGELQGVRIREQGRIGAEKIFNFVKRFGNDDMLTSLTRGVGVIRKRTRYVRAMNFIMADLESTYLVSEFGENPGYFQLHRRRKTGEELVCSVPYPDQPGWEAIDNHTVTIL